MRTQHEDWKRLPKGTLKLLPDGRKCLEWTVATPPQGGFLEIAFSYPYDLEQLKSLLTETRGFWRCDELGVTAEDRRILRISNCYGSAEQPVPGLYLLARQHAGETPGSWVLDGVLRELARQRIQFPVWCVPMVDVDGVCNGDYGKDSYPHDMNRAWGPYELMRRETKVISADIQEWRGRVIPERSLVLDFHAPGAEETGIYAYASPEVRIHRPECCIENWLRKLGKALAPYAQKPFIHQNGYKKYSAWGDFASLTEFCLWSVPCPFASFETSYSQAGGKVMKREDYQALGALMAQEILRYLQRDQD